MKKRQAVDPESSTEFFLEPRTVQCTARGRYPLRINIDANPSIIKCQKRGV